MIRATIVGNVTHDIHLITDDQNRPTAYFRIASHRLYKNSEEVTPVDFVSVKVFGKLATNCAEHIGKGCTVAASGDLETFPSKEDPNRTESVLVARSVEFIYPRGKREDTPPDDMEKIECTTQD